jgi:hypothetical protein
VISLVSRSFTAARVFSIHRRAPAAHLGAVLGHDVRDGMALRLLLQGARDPGTLGAGKEVGHRGLVLGERTIVEVGRVVQMARVSLGVHLDVEHAPRNSAALAFLIEEQRMTYLADSDPDLALWPCERRPCTYRTTLGRRAGQKVLSHG